MIYLNLKDNREGYVMLIHSYTESNSSVLRKINPFGFIW